MVGFVIRNRRLISLLGGILYLEEWKLFGLFKPKRIQSIRYFMSYIVNNELRYVFMNQLEFQNWMKTYIGQYKIKEIIKIDQLLKIK